MNNKFSDLPRCKDCFICGSDNPDGLNLQFKTDDKGRVIGEFMPKETLIGFKGMMHGGIISSVLDDSMSWACSVRTGKLYVTSRLTVNFKKPVPVDKKLVVIAEGDYQLGEPVKRTMNAKAQLTDYDGTIYAEGEGLFFSVSDAKAETFINSFVKNDGSTASFQDFVRL